MNESSSGRAVDVEKGLASRAERVAAARSPDDDDDESRYMRCVG